MSQAKAASSLGAAATAGTMLHCYKIKTVNEAFADAITPSITLPHSHIRVRQASQHELNAAQFGQIIIAYTLGNYKVKILYLGLITCTLSL